MQKLTLVVAMAAAVLGATAGAADVKTQLLGCARMSDGTSVACTFNLTTGDDRDTSETRFNKTDVVMNIGGTPYPVRQLAVGSQEPVELTYTYLPAIDIYKNAPSYVKFIATGVPRGATRVDAIKSTGSASFVFTGIPITGANPAPASVTRAPAPAVTVNSGDYNINLTGCKGADGRYTCTGATVTPRN
ncbi:hypothetical protein [Deinococcus sp. PESE-13]